MTILLDPTSEAVPAERARAERLTELEGRTVGLLDIAFAPRNMNLLVVVPPVPPVPGRLVLRDLHRGRQCARSTIVADSVVPLIVPLTAAHG